LRSSEPPRTIPVCSNLPATVAFFLFPILLLWTSFANAQTVGKVQNFAGDVRLERAAHPVPVTVGMDVIREDRFTTGANGRLVIVLNDQSSLDLYDSSQLVVNDQTIGAGGAASTHVSLFAGIMRSIVHATAGATPNFAVHTPNAIAAARGTDYDTGYHGNEHRANYPDCLNFTDVFTREGQVQVTGTANPAQPVTLGPNQSTTVACSAPPVAPGAGMGAFALYATGTAAVLEGAIVGGYAGAGGFGGGGGGEKKKHKTPHE